MNIPLYAIPLKIAKKIYTNLFSVKQSNPDCIHDPIKASQIIYDALKADSPCMIARFGSNELNTLLNYQSIISNSKSFKKYIKGEQSDWWWNKNIIRLLNEVAGFFPPTTEKIEQFCELMLKDINEVDILGSWLSSEKYFENYLKNTQKVHLRLLEPYWSDVPWSRALEGKKVLVVHPFINEIKKQYERKELLFKNNILPDFELITLKSVLSLANEKTVFNDWFEALEYMKSEIDKIDYDICLIGAGAYGFLLAAHVKRMGKKGFHLGGALQLLFGIRGKRWEDPNYGVKDWGIPTGYYSELMNEYWVRPGENEKPVDVDKVEGACYW
jgi:hypothetical protein